MAIGELMLPELTSDPLTLILAAGDTAVGLMDKVLIEYGTDIV